MRCAYTGLYASTCPQDLKGRSSRGPRRKNRELSGRSSGGPNYGIISVNKDEFAKKSKMPGNYIS